MSSELGAGGVSCLDVSDLSSGGHPSPHHTGMNNGRNSLTEMDLPENEKQEMANADNNVLHDYRQTKAFQTLLRR